LLFFVNQTRAPFPIHLIHIQTYPTLTAYYQWTNVGKPLFEDYAAKNGGRSPHINPEVRFRWRFGESKGADAYADELERRENFENWTLSHFVRAISPRLLIPRRSLTIIVMHTFS
jgi:hypothetical protein